MSDTKNSLRSVVDIVYATSDNAKFDRKNGFLTLTIQLKNEEGVMEKQAFDRVYLHRAFPFDTPWQFISVCDGDARELAIIALTRLELIDYFDFVVDGYQHGVNKTSPQFFHMMAEKMGVEAKDMCVFEDAVYSIRSAKEAGCSVVGIEDQTQRNDREEIIRLSDVYIREYEELL